MKNNSKIIGYIVKNITLNYKKKVFTYDQYFEYFDNGTLLCPKYFFDRNYDILVIHKTEVLNIDVAVINREYIYYHGPYFSEIIEDIRRIGLKIEFGKILKYNKKIIKGIKC